MKKRGLEGRVQIKPRLLPQVEMPSARCLSRMSKQLEIPKEEIARGIQNERIVVSRKNTGSFYVKLFSEIYHGKILRDSGLPLFPDLAESYSSYDFRPDVVVNGSAFDTLVEVKAVSMHTGAPLFGLEQIANYTCSVVENPATKWSAAIFKYGGGGNLRYHICEKDERKAHGCDSRCLMEKLSAHTRSLLVLPHNLLTLLLVLAPLNQLNQTTSMGSRDNVGYKMPYGGWFSLLEQNYQDPQTAVGLVLESASQSKKFLSLGSTEYRDFFLENLTAKQFQSPKNVYYGRHKVNQFRITEYALEGSSGWGDYFRNNLDRFLDGLWITPVYRDIVERRSEKMAEKDLPGVPDSKDSIPF